MDSLFQQFQQFVITNPLYANLIALVLTAWSVVWKGMALWKSSRKGSKIWFVIILMVNTVGLLEIAYIYLLSKIRWEDVTNKFKFLKKVNIQALKPQKENSKKKK